MLMTDSDIPQIVTVNCISAWGCYSWLTMGHLDLSVSRKRSFRAADDPDDAGGLVAQWQRAAGMATVVWSHGLYLCSPLYLFPILHQAVCLLSSPLPPHPPTFPPVFPPFLPLFTEGSFCVSLTSSLLRSLCFAQTTAYLKILALGPPPCRHTDPRTES